MILSVIMIGVLGAGVALFVLWRQATIERNTAQSEKLASEATGNLNSDPELGVLLALQAIKIRETPQAVTALAELIPAVREIRTYQLGNTEASWASFSTDGNEVVVATGNGWANIYSAETGRLMHRISAGRGNAFNTAVFSPNGNQILTSSDDGTARLFSVSTGRQTSIMTPQPSGYYLRDAVFNHQGTEIATTDDGEPYGYVDIWSASGKPRKLLRRITVTHSPAGTSYVYGTAFSPDGTEIATSDGDRYIRVWNTQTGELVGSIPPYEGTHVNSVTFSPDGRTLLAAYQSGFVAVWNVSTASPIATFESTGTAEDANFSPNGAEVVIATDNGRAIVWRPDTDSQVATFSSHVGTIQSATFSPNGEEILTANENGTVQIWGLHARASTGSLLSSFTAGSSPLANTLYVSGTGVVTGNWTGQITVWNPARGRVTKVQSDPSGIAHLTVARAGRILVAVNNDGTVTTWNLPQMTPRSRIQGNNYSVVAYGPEQAFVGFSDRTKGVLYPNASNHSIGLPAIYTTAATFNADGSELLTVADHNQVVLWNSRNGEKIRSFVDPADARNVNDAEFSYDGSRIVLADDLGHAFVFDTNTGNEIADLDAGTGYLDTAVFAPRSDNEIVTAGDDGAVRIWDVNSQGELAAASTQGAGSAQSAVFYKGGSEVLMGSVDGKVRIWSFGAPTVTALVQRAERIVTRTLTSRERAEYVVNSAQSAG